MANRLGTNGPGRTPAPEARFAFTCLFLALSAYAAGWAATPGDPVVPARPGAIEPRPPQRGLDEIAAIPVKKVPCPSCGHEVEIPEVDKLMRRPAGGDAAEPVWEMHRESVDSDLCPHPGKGKVRFQADIAVCPSCGFAAKAGDFALPLPRRLIAWIDSELKPNLRETQKKIIGARSATMSDAEIIEFFSNQADIPDAIRLEHARVFHEANGAAQALQAEMSWLAAWAARRELASPPKGAFLARRAENVAAEMAKSAQHRSGVTGEVEILRRLVAKNRSGKDRLEPGERWAARMMLAGRLVRLGRYQEAEKELSRLYLDAHERFLRSDQDPLWQYTSSKASRLHRADELERFRADIETETMVRIELVRAELRNLLRAVDHIREAIMLGEFDGDRENALFHAYLAGDFLRRGDHLPLAAEWFRNIVIIEPAGTRLRAASEARLEEIREQAGESVNLLSALGQDGDVFEKLREICGE